MHWLFKPKKRPIEMLPQDRIREIRSLSSGLDSNTLMHTIVLMVSDRNDITPHDRSMLFLRLGARMVATSPRPDL